MAKKRVLRRLPTILVFCLYRKDSHYWRGFPFLEMRREEVADTG